MYGSGGGSLLDSIKVVEVYKTGIKVEEKIQKVKLLFLHAFFTHDKTSYLKKLGIDQVQKTTENSSVTFINQLFWSLKSDPFE